MRTCTFGLCEDVEIRLAEVSRAASGTSGSISDDGLAFHSRIDRYRARRDSRAAADDQHRARDGRGQSGEVSQHALQPHVARNIRGLNLSRDMKGENAIGKARNSHRRIHSFARVDNVALPSQVAA